MPANESWGLDIGQTAIHAVKIRREGRRGVIGDAYFQELATWLDDPEYEDKVLDALRTFSEEKKVGVTPVVCAIPGFMTLFRDFATTAGGRLRDVVMLEAKQRIPYPLDDVIWDFHKLRDDGAGEATVGLVCCRKDIVAGILGILDQAKLSVAAMQVAPLALMNYIAFDRPPPDGSAQVVIDSGARGTDLVILNDEGFWLRPIGVSGHDLTRALMTKLAIPFDQAEREKRELDAGGAQRDRAFKQALEPVLRTLASETQRSLGFYRAQNRGVAIGKKLTLAGNVYRLGRVAKFLAESLEFSVEPLGAPKTMDVDTGIEAALVNDWNVSGVAIGLGLQGVELTRVTINLLPSDRRIARAIQSKLKYAVAGVGMVGATALFNMALSGGMHSMDRYEASVDKARQAQGKVQQARKEYQVAQEKGKEPEELARTLVARATTRSNLLEAYTAVMKRIEDFNDPKGSRNSYILEVGRRIEQGRGQPATLTAVSASTQTAAAPKPLSHNAVELAKFNQAKQAYGNEWPALLKNLQEQFDLRKNWLSDRAARIYVDRMDLVPGKVFRRVGAAKGQKMWEADSWLAGELTKRVSDPNVLEGLLPEQAPSASGTGGGMDFTNYNPAPAAPKPSGPDTTVVAVLLSGRLICSGFKEEDTRQVAEYFQRFRESLATMHGALPDSLVMVQRLTEQSTQKIPIQKIRVPKLTPQPIPETPKLVRPTAQDMAAELAPESGRTGGRSVRSASPGRTAPDGTADAAPQTPPQTISYGDEEEPVASWSVAFFYQAAVDR